jgi:hypothetical protein
VIASTLTKKLKFPSCCTPSVNSMLTLVPGASGVAVVIGHHAGVEAAAVRLRGRRLHLSAFDGHA